MATRTFHTSAAHGALMIVKSGKTDAQLAAIAQSPYSYLNDIYFHTGLDYVQGLGKVTKGSITFGAVTRSVVSWENSSSCTGLC